MVLLASVFNAMPDQREKTFREMMRTVNAGDAKAYAKLYASNAKIIIYGGETPEGRAAIEQYEVELLAQFPGVDFRIFDVWLDGTDRAVARYGVYGQAGDKPMGHEGLLFYRFDSSGSIAEERRYLDSLTPMAQLGALGPGSVRKLPDLPRSMRLQVSSPQQTKIELAKSIVTAVEDGKLATVRAALAESAVLDDMSETEPRIGSAAVLDCFAGWERATAGAKTEVSTVIAAGDQVLIESATRGILRNGLGRVPASTKPFLIHRAWIIEIAEGKVKRITVFMNGKELAESTGNWPLKPSRSGR